MKRVCFTFFLVTHHVEDRAQWHVYSNPITVTRIFFHWSMGFIVIIRKNPLRNGNSPITDTITETGVTNAFEQTVWNTYIIVMHMHIGLFLKVS
jgi:hypothetical protein